MKRTINITLALLLAFTIAPSCDMLEEVDLSDDPMPVFVEPAYVDNGDGTITDTTTNGIMWEKCAKGETYNAGSCSGIAVSDTYYNGGDYCGASTSGEYSDWRLPTRHELKTLSFASVSYLSFFGKYDTEKALFWWSSSETSSNFSIAVKYNPVDYEERNISMTSDRSIRCARAIQP